MRQILPDPGSCNDAIERKIVFITGKSICVTFDGLGNSTQKKKFKILTANS